MPASGIVDEAEVVIVGGGVIGCSIAYHLCRLGMNDVLLLERHELSTEATARAAGLVLHASAERSVIRMVARTCAAIAELDAEFGEDVGFRRGGSISALQSPDRLADAISVEALLEAEGCAVAALDAAEARALCPWLEPGGAERITFTGSDGHIDGARLATGYARAARRLGARIRRGVAVNGFAHDGARIAGVTSSAGTIRAGTVVCAAGAWSVALLHGLGWGMPAAPVRSHYWITAPDGTGAPGQPNVLLPDLRTYFRAELGGMVMGFQEPHSQTGDPFALGETTDSSLRFDEATDTDLLVEHAAAIGGLVPSLDAWRFAHHVVGFSMYTPDGKILLGPVPETAGLILAGGCCGSGIAMSGGIGSTAAEMIAGRPLSIDAAPFDPGRFGRVDPAAVGFRELCAAARSRKSRGRVAAAPAG